MYLGRCLEAKQTSLLLLLVLTFSHAAADADLRDVEFYLDVDPTYGGKWNVRFGCWLPSEPSVRVEGCTLIAETDTFQYGCCLQTESYIGAPFPRLTCPYEGTLCLYGGDYIPAVHRSDKGAITPGSAAIATPDAEQNRKKSLSPVVMAVIILVCILLVGGAAICGCNYYTELKNTSGDDITSLISQEDTTPPIPHGHSSPKSLFLRIKGWFGNSLSHRSAYLSEVTILPPPYTDMV